MAYYNKSPQNNGDGKSAEDRALDTFANMMIEKIESLGSKDGWQKPWFTEGTTTRLRPMTTAFLPLQSMP